MAISSPPYSFVQFNGGSDDCCPGIADSALPVLNSTDLYFQVLSTSAPGALLVVDEDGATVSSQSGFVDAGNNYYTWSNPIDISGLACSECFQLKIGTALSNVFKKVCDDCYTSILEYFNEEDYAEFLYCNLAFVNRVRLPFYLDRPKFPQEKTVYRKSNGVIRQRKSLITKEYEVLTEFMTETMHQALVVALAHDSTNVISSKYTGGIFQTGDYAIGWEDGMCIAPAEFKVSVTPFAVRNNNCQDCPDPEVCVEPTVPSLGLADGNVGTPYNDTVTLGGTAPFTLSNVVKPSWMTIDVTGNTVTFSGTPDTEDTDITVSFDVTNACGTDSGSDTIDVTDTPCVEVGIVGTPSLPDAGEGMAYSYSFDLSGTGPFSLTSVVKPSWMTIDIVGSAVNFGGTPGLGDVGTDIDVSFTVTNCDDAYDEDFADVIDVIQTPRTLTFYAIMGVPSYSQIVAEFNAAIDIDIDIVNMLADGYDTGDCSELATASVQAHDLTILAGGLSQSGSVFPTGDWELVNSFIITSVDIDTGVYVGGVIDAQVIVMGSYSVTIIFDGC